MLILGGVNIFIEVYDVILMTPMVKIIKHYGCKLPHNQDKLKCILSCKYLGYVVAYFATAVSYDCCTIALFTTVINRRARIRHQCKELSCHRCLIKTGVEKMNNI